MTILNAFVYCAFGVKDSVQLAMQLEAQLSQPVRPYHNVVHTGNVLERVFDWTQNRPNIPLVLAALYHDAIYDSTGSDNEAQSAEFCRKELATTHQENRHDEEIKRLILLTRQHCPEPEDRDGICLSDADLYILSATPRQYREYVQAVRAEYSHVSDDAWAKGRQRFLSAFLERPQIYQGAWFGVDEWERQARLNMADEIHSLTSGLRKPELGLG